MSRTQPVAPTVTASNSSVGGTTESHPAYGMIGAARVSHGTGLYLYGSDFRHRSYVVIRILASDVTRGLSHDWPHGDMNREYIEVALSEAQWAGFVSTLNMGDGVQCTVQAVNNRDVPGIAYPTNRREQFTGELREHLLTLEADVAALAQQIEESKTSARDKEAMRTRLIHIRNNLTPNLDYIQKCWGEHVNTTAERAKAEVGAYIQQTLVRAGMKHLAETNDGPIDLLGDGKREESE